jgi:hypothetical protein
MPFEIEKYEGHEVVVLYRPTGQKEYELVKESNFTQWPPRLPEQPIFYPVLNEDYANEIASKWNTKDTFSNHVGYVTKFRVLKAFLSKYKIEVVGGKQHEELWVPAEELEELNKNIVGKIEIINKFS